MEKLFDSYDNLKLSHDEVDTCTVEKAATKRDSFIRISSIKIDPIAGTGPCKSCGCKGFTQGKGSYCGTCRHHYDQHKGWL